MTKVYRIWLLFILLFTACASEPPVYTPLDYTTEDVLNNEIKEITEVLARSPVEALWRAVLMKQNVSVHSTVVQDTFDACTDAVVTAYRNAVVSKNYAAAAGYYLSLQSAACPIPEDIIQEASELADTLLAQTPGLNRNSNVSDSAPASVASYINGTVTVWVDLGITVSKGVGYADRVIGSGFFIDTSGYIVTNYHVIQTEVDPSYEGYSRVYIKLASDSDTRIPAKVVGWDPLLDLALLKTEVDAPYSFALGSSADLDPGDRIYAIGSPAGLERTLTSGIVSAVDRKLFTVGSVMQIDAAINSGNSGGPIIDRNGNVQAVVFAGMLQYEGLNFAIPVEYLKSELPYLAAGGLRRHGWIGAYGSDCIEDSFTGRPAGLEIQYVMPGGSASRAGLIQGDVITGINGKAVAGLDAFQTEMIRQQPDTIVTITLWRSGIGEMTLPVYLAERPKSPGYEIYRRDVVYHAFVPIFGMELTPVSSGKKKYTISRILKGSTADESGFSVHDPVEIVKITVSEEEDIMYAQVYTKKRKNGYFEVNIMIGAALDSPYYF